MVYRVPSATTAPLRSTSRPPSRVSRSPSCTSVKICSPTSSISGIPASSRRPGPRFGYRPDTDGTALTTAATSALTSASALTRSRSVWWMTAISPAAAAWSGSSCGGRAGPGHRSRWEHLVVAAASGVSSWLQSRCGRSRRRSSTCSSRTRRALGAAAVVTLREPEGRGPLIAPPIGSGALLRCSKSQTWPLIKYRDGRRRPVRPARRRGPGPTRWPPGRPSSGPARRPAARRRPARRRWW